MTTMTVLGGAGSLKDIGELISAFGIIGTAAGSLFVFKGVYRAVLISYPSRSEKDALILKSSRAASSFGYIDGIALAGDELENKVLQANEIYPTT